MWLQHFTDKALPGLTLLGLALAASGCASSGPRADGAESGRTEQSAPGDPGAAEVPPEALTMYEQAVAVMASGDFLDAELRFKEFVLLAIIHVNDDNDEDARAAVNAALALNSEYAPALNQLGMLLRRNGKFLEAEAAYLKAVTAKPDYALAHYNLGVLNELYLQRLMKCMRADGRNLIRAGIVMAIALASLQVSAQDGADELEPAVDTSAAFDDAEALEPAVDTSAEPAAEEAEAVIAQDVTRRESFGGVMDEMTLGRTEITGNQELPKVLYIVPWQKAQPGELTGRPVNTLLDEVLAPLDREEFTRQVDFYGDLYGDEE
jgi:tetratricopeptide (TPR) repeat protein